jgi:hypothetical protein
MSDKILALIQRCAPVLHGLGEPSIDDTLERLRLFLEQATPDQIIDMNLDYSCLQLERAVSAGSERDMLRAIRLLFNPASGDDASATERLLLFEAEPMVCARMPQKFDSLGIPNLTEGNHVAVALAFHLSATTASRFAPRFQPFMSQHLHVQKAALASLEFSFSVAFAAAERAAAPAASAGAAAVVADDAPEESIEAVVARMAASLASYTPPSVVDVLRGAFRAPFVFDKQTSINILLVLTDAEGPMGDAAQLASLLRDLALHRVVIQFMNISGAESEAYRADIERMRLLYDGWLFSELFASTVPLVGDGGAPDFALKASRAFASAFASSVRSAIARSQGVSLDSAAAYAAAEAAADAVEHAAARAAADERDLRVEALFRAARTNDTGSAVLHHLTSADWRAHDPQGRTPACIAVINGSYDFIQYMYHHHVPIGGADGTGHCALSYAVTSASEREDFRILVFLLSKRICSLTDKQKALAVARESGRTGARVAEELITHPEPLTQHDVRCIMERHVRAPECREDHVLRAAAQTGFRAANMCLAQQKTHRHDDEDEESTLSSADAADAGTADGELSGSQWRIAARTEGGRAPTVGTAVLSSADMTADGEDDEPPRPVSTADREQHAALQAQHAALQAQHAALQAQHAALQEQHAALQAQLTEIRKVLGA